ncbi:hypothetical protein NE237_005097 [Protea cynaroides]|uniref:WAT1-related protein n=1 Tax=Protea cynaroides TaxID=273540 RepID=A0A9Q0QU50_9MAGN|nr:hypothetical protein NE237_005097 [Protea cynaroides]
MSILPLAMDEALSQCLSMIQNLEREEKLRGVLGEEKTRAKLVEGTWVGETGWEWEGTLLILATGTKYRWQKSVSAIGFKVPPRESNFRAKGSAKVIGTLICIAGALTFTFWKERYLFERFFKNPLTDINPTGGSVHGLRHHKEDWIKGALLILTSYIAWSAWLMLLSLVFSVYPAPLSLNTLICFFASLQTSILALIFERDPASWRLERNVQLLTIFYFGVVNSGFVSYLQTWCIGKKGPVFSAMFTPLSLLIVGIFSAIFFAKQLHLGSLIGAFFTVVGLYTVLWGKSTDTCSEDKKVGNDRSSLDHQTLEIPIADQPLSMAIPITTGKN